MIVIGMIILLLAGGVLVIAGCQIIAFLNDVSGIAFVFFGGLMIWLACHLSPWSLTISVAAS